MSINIAKEERTVNYDAIIIGGGITGTALLYTLSNYTNLKKIALIEKYSTIASLNSNCDNNSQTLHFGDIESNYSYKKAKEVSEKAELVAGFLENYANDGTFYKRHKLLLAVGDKEIKKVKDRFEEIKDLFPNIKMLNKEEIEKLEPKITKGRDPKINLIALHSPDGYAIDFAKLSNLFVKLSNGNTNIFLGTEVVDIKYEIMNQAYTISILGKNQKIYTLKTKTILVCAGAHSLILAKNLGIGKDLGILPVTGSFFKTTKQLNGKVYTLQKKKLPFAAIHGDPNVNNFNETRFGPTSWVFPILEKDNWKTFPDFVKTSTVTINGVLSILKIISDPIILKFVLHNFLYDLPYFGKKFFLKEVKKIIPSIRLNELDYHKGIGGIRPQIIDTKKKELVMGEGKIYGRNAIFNITPSPGASNCLANARDDAIKLKEFFGEDYAFDLEKFVRDNSR